jgi:ubiquinone/menaquinone biosynthesis C-methylase UbiE
MGIPGVEFKLLDLEWIDLPAASVDAALCRWGIMLVVDPSAAAREVRRVLKSGGRAAFAVWDGPARNPWATIPGLAMIDLGHAEPPDANAPGMFALAPDGRLAGLLQDAGFTEVTVEPVALARNYEKLDTYMSETIDMSPSFGPAFRDLSESEQAAVRDLIEAGARPFADGDGKVELPGSTLVAIASA